MIIYSDLSGCRQLQKWLKYFNQNLTWISVKREDDDAAAEEIPAEYENEEYDITDYDEDEAYAEYESR